MEQLFSFLTLVGMGLVLFLFLKWMVRAGQTHNKNPLTPADLKLLEEVAARLTADIRAAAEECVARVEQACERAESLLRNLERANSSVVAEQSTQFAGNKSQRIPIGEVELLRGLSGLVRTQSQDASSAPCDYHFDSQVC